MAKRASAGYPSAVANAFLAMLSVAAPALLQADEDTPSLALRYFGTAGLTYVTSGQADFVRDLSQPDGPKGGQWSGTVDSLAGAQANFRIDEQFEVVGQAVSRHRYDDTFIPELTWAFLKYSPRPDVELRGGRLGTDFYMRADSRLVGYSNLTVRPSVDYYGGLPYQYIDGVDGAVTVPMGDGLLRGKLFGGISPEKIPLENSAPWNASGSLFVGGSLDYQWDAWQFRIGYAEIRHKHDLPGSFATLLATLHQLPLTTAQAAAEALTVRDTASRHYSAGMVYDEGPLQVQLMVSGVKHESAFFQDGVAGYLLAGYRIGDVTPYAGLSWSHTNATRLNTMGAQPLDTAIVNTIGRTRSDQHTYTLGARWDFHPGMDIKAQWDAVLGAPDSTFLYRNEQPGWTGNTHVLSVVMDFAF